MSTLDAIQLDRADHVATVLRRIERGEAVSIAGPCGAVRIIAAEAIPIFHKIAITGLRAGSDVRKHGDSIGVLVTDIEEGVLVHVHNLRSKKAVGTTKTDAR